MSVAVHAGMGMALGVADSSRDGGDGPVQATMTVSLRAGAERMVRAVESEPATPVTDAIPLVAEGEASAAISAAAESGPHYFGAGELTEKPVLVQDISSAAALALPGIFPQPAILTLFINEHGTIDRVTIEKPALSENAERFVVEAFSQIRFEPGKIGDMPVGSQLTIEIRSDNPDQLIPQQ